MSPAAETPKKGSTAHFSAETNAYLRELFKRFAKASGIEQHGGRARLARRLGVSPQALIQYEKGGGFTRVVAEKLLVLGNEHLGTIPNEAKKELRPLTVRHMPDLPPENASTGEFLEWVLGSHMAFAPGLAKEIDKDPEGWTMRDIVGVLERAVAAYNRSTGETLLAPEGGWTALRDDIRAGRIGPPGNDDDVAKLRADKKKRKRQR